MKSKNFKEFFDKFKEQSTCLICGRPIYIRSIDHTGGLHMIKACYKHSYQYGPRTVSIGENQLVFDTNGLLMTITKTNIVFNPRIDIMQTAIPYNEQSFIVFIQNWKILA